jgi:hypothetical protein
MEHADEPFASLGAAYLLWSGGIVQDVVRSENLVRYL